MNIEKILSELTVEEKVCLLEGKDIGYLNRVDRLDIPRILMVDGPHGVRVTSLSASDEEPYQFGEGLPATCLPNAAAMAATWNLPLIANATKKLGLECQNYGVNVLLGPGVNGKRSPLGGRNFEYFSEDPLLSGKMAASFINGVQSEGVGTSLKHFAVNDQETRRMSVNANLDERTLREIYLRPFEIAIKEAHPWTVMASYNRVRGEYACENHYLLQDILRNEFGFDGVVISDWSAVVNKVAAHKNGLNIEMPGPGYRSQELMEAIEKGEFTLEELDDRVKPVLKLIEKAVNGIKKVMIDWEQHHKTAVEVAEEAVVLLKNQEDILPLSKNANIAVVGQFAKIPRFKGGGSANVTPRTLDLPLDSIQQFANVVYADGYDDDKTNDDLINEAKSIAAGKDAVIVFVATVDTEGLDRKDMLLYEAHIRLINELAEVNPNIIVVNQSGSAVEFRQIDKAAKAILQSWILGEGGGSAIANILFGVANPSGKLSETFPVSLANTPAYQHFPGYKDEVYYNEGLLVGYRYYDTAEISPQYPFGFGLSYTNFAYSNLKLSKSEMKNGDKVAVSIDVTNTGKCYGKEVVQVYVEDLESLLFRPKKELKGFEKIDLQPGETKTVNIILDESAFSYFVPHLNRFAVESGMFRIKVGASSQDIRCCEILEFKSQDEVREPLTGHDLLKDFIHDDRYNEITEQLMKLLHMDEKSEFYLILYGSDVRNLPGMLAFVGIPMEVGEVLKNCLIDRKPIPNEIIEKLDTL